MPESCGVVASRTSTMPVITSGTAKTQSLRGVQPSRLPAKSANASPSSPMCE